MPFDRTELGFRFLRFLLKLLGLRLFLKLYNMFLASDSRHTGEVAPLYTGPIKLPPFYDISHWKIVNDWYHINPPPLMMGTKATQGVDYRDPTFPEYFQKFRDILHCARLAYHFFEKTMDPVRQANWFADYISPYLEPDDIICLDFEQGGETASQLWAFLDQLHKRFPNQQMIYSRKNLMDPISMTSSEKTFFKTKPSWVAGYPTDPSQYTTTPAMYIPDQTKWGPVWAWQYTDSAHIGGIDGDTDANLMEPPLIDLVNDTEPPIDDEVTNPYQGVERTVGRRFGSDIYVTVIVPTFVRFQVVHESPLDNGLFLTSQYCNIRHAQLGWNGDEWDKNAPLPAKPKNIAYSDGVKYVGRISAEPSLNVRNTGVSEIIHAVNGQEYNTSSGRRYLIENGQIKSYLSGSEPQYTERHPRGLTGITGDGKVIMLTVDGRSDRSQGVTLKEGAQILLEFGAYVAYDRGGGGDAVDVMDGVVQNIPCDTGINGQPGVERAIPQSILVYATKESNMFRYDATANGDGTRVRTDHNTAATAVASYNRGAVFQGNELFVAPSDLSNASGVYQKTGDKWLRAEVIDGAPQTQILWVAVLHMGSQQICTLVDHGAPPPTNETLHVVATQGTDKKWEGDLPKV